MACPRACRYHANIRPGDASKAGVAASIVITRTNFTEGKMKRWGLLLLLAAAPALAAQTPADTGRTAHRAVARAERMRELLGLTDDQAVKLKATAQRFREQRQAIMKQQRELSGALRAQIRPGIAANSDSVRKLLDAREQGITALGQLRRDENRELAGYLSPVQRAQLQLARERWRGRFAHMRGYRHGGWHGRGSRDS
jgi:Spy/CpxP family protein refolding chaperone